MKEANVRNGDDTIRILLTQNFHFNSLIIPYPRPTRLSLQLNTMLTHRFSLVLMVSRNATTVFAVLVRIAVVAVAAPPPPPLPTPALPLEAGRLPVVLDTAECSGAFLVRPNQFIVAISYEHRRAGVVVGSGGYGLLRRRRRKQKSKNARHRLACALRHGRGLSVTASRVEYFFFFC